MNSNFKRSLSLALAALMCAATLSACASDEGKNNPDVTTAAPVAGDTTPVTTEPATTETTRITPNLPEANFNEHKFTVLTRGQSSSVWYSRDIYAEGMSGDVINDAVYARNKKIEQQYNFEIVEVGSDDVGNVAKNSILSQNDEFDMIAGRVKDHMTSLITQGYLLDLNKIERMDLTQPYYDQSSMESLSIGNKRFLITGDLLTMDNDATRCILFNKPLFENLQLKDKIGGTLYEIAEDGKWTLEVFETCAASAAADLNGDQVMDNQDQWGVAHETFNALGFLSAAGLAIFEKDPTTDLPAFAGNNEKVISSLQRIITLMNAEHSFISTNAYNVYPMFQNGQLLFHPSNLAEVTNTYRAMEFDFGILPMPKYDEKQERYYSPVTAWGSNCISVPITASDLDRTGTIIEALSCESMYTVTPAYFDVALGTKAVRDEESAEMLETVLSTAVLELTFMWNWGGVYDAIANAAGSNNLNFASTFKVYERVAANAIETTVKAVEAAS